MCDKPPRPRKKLEPPPLALKIMKRIKLADKKQVAKTAARRSQEDVEAEPLGANTSRGELVEEEVEDWEALEAYVESEQDRLVEEILQKRRLNRRRPSYEYLEEEEEEVQGVEERVEAKFSSKTAESSSSSDSSVDFAQGPAKPKVSINAIIKERILYHGLNKYPDDYDKTKYWPAVPGPKKRLPATLVQTEVPVSTSDSSASLRSSSASSDASNLFDREVLNYKSDAEDRDQTEAEIQKGPELSKSSMNMKSIASETQLLPKTLESDDAIIEQLVALDMIQKQKKKSTLFRTIRRIPGYPKCTDATVGFPECLPPGEIVRKAIRPDLLWGIPLHRALSKEQFIELMQRIEDYPTNDYIYLSYMYRPKSQEFNPYLFKIVAFKDVDPKNYFTLSKSGIMYFQNGMAEYTSIVKFIKQIYIFERLRKVPFLTQYPMYKAFRIWRSNICQTRMKKNRKQLEEALFTTKRPLRGMLSLLFRMIEKISEMGFLSLVPSPTYEVKDFVSSQEVRLEVILKRFQAFERIVTDLTENACRTYLVECGFSTEHYVGEVEFYKRGLTVPTDQLTDEVANFLDYPGQWLPYSLQAKKKRICGRLSNFVHLVDFYVQAAYHRLLKISVLQLAAELYARARLIPKELAGHGQPKYTHNFQSLRRKNEPVFGKLIPWGGHGPIFELGCAYTEDILTFTPPQDRFLKYIRSIFSLWKNGICVYKNLLPDDTFNPYTRPIVNGYMEEKTCGDGPSLEFHYNTDPDLFEVQETIEMIINHSFEACRQYVDTLDFIRVFCVENDEFDVSKLLEIEDGNQLMELLEKYHNQLKQVDDIEGDKIIGIFHVDNGIFRENAFPSVMRIIDVLHDHVPTVAGNSLRALTDRIGIANDKIGKYPETADQYVDYLLFLDEIQEQFDDIERELDDCADLADLIEIYKMTTTDEDIAGFASLVPMLSKLRTDIEIQVDNREKLIAELVEQFELFNKKVFADMKEIRKRADAPDVLDPKSDPPYMQTVMEDCKDILTDYVERAAKFNKYQRQLKLEVTNYDSLDHLIFQVRLRHQLWESMHNWDVQKDIWDNASFATLDDEEMTKEVVKYVKSIHQLEKGLPPNDVVPILKAKVDAMKIQISLISHLHNPNIRQRHWDVLETTMNLNLTEADVTLKKLNESGIETFTEFIQEVSAQASSEFSLEALLKKVEESWREVEFVVVPHKDQRNVFILGGTDEIQVLLDDSNLHMATISSSRHVGPIKPKVDEWVRLLDLFSRTLEEWLNCQRNWIYLESIFSAPDIQRQLPVEAKLFGQVDKSWGEVMQRTNKMPAALRAATTPGLLEQLIQNNEMLDQILKCLDNYLESKRVIFPRFYFLSNEELLEILAQTRNPQAVQPHLRKCFDAIQKLEFGGPANAIALDVLAMFSPEDERVKLTRGLKARGNVEEWLGKVEDSMVMSLKQIMRNALQDYHVLEREDWLQRFPSQIVLTISQLMWAQKVHEILDAPGNTLQGMNDFELVNFENLAKLATMVRGQLSSLVRAVLCALITVDVHARDIITSMVVKKVEASTDFEWLKQLRYYWEPKQEVVVAKMAISQYFYGYEYLGASPRLVVTPLTDRCYLCLMGALQLDLGGAPAGPAGTGKTETTKDLAKALAFMCVVFNCSEGLDYKMMGRFFSGLAQSGGWCCFDEFNRIDIEVLSVIAQQLITIRLAKVQKLSRFLFEGREIRLVKTCSAFITMNPGYAGRTELPDNLKALFRPISMMVPDYTLIAEVILYSEGFESSKSLANKMTQMYKLCSEQLSQQDHYDFGMRAVKSVLVMAGSLKRSNPTINENIVLIRALRDSNLPKFLAHDAVLLQGIIQDLFPGVVIPEQDYGVLLTEAVKMCMNRGLQAPDYFILKVIQLFETLVVRHGVMLVGKTGGGKTTCYQILKAALTSLYQLKVDGAYFRPVDTYVLNPKAVSMGELYGEVNPLTLEWRDGLLGIMVRTSVKPKMTYNQWIVCDGPVDAIWIENMNTVLDDNKMLCLANSERIKLTNWVRMLFEVQDLAQASPATVSRCGMVYIDNSNAGMGWRAYVETFLASKISKERKELQPYLERLFFTYVDAGFTFVQKNCQELIPQANLGKISMLCSILDAILNKKDMDYTMEKIKFLQVVSQIFVFAYLWSIGGNIHENNYDKFSIFVKEQFEAEEFCKLPKTRDLWSYYNSMENRRMETWESILPSYVYDPRVSFVDILVPTIDTVRFGYLMELLLSVDRAVLFTGFTGTGKSAIAKYVLDSILRKTEYVSNFINFSAQTTSQRTQEMIEGKLEKRRKTQLSAPFGKKAIFFVDDLNMPKLDRYGAQPALELLRQILDFNGCYDRHKNYWKELQNVLFSSACAPPGGGRNSITPRLLRHFCMLAIPTPTTAVLKQIYRAIVKGCFEEFDPEIREMSDSIVNAAIETYQFMTVQYRPTIAKAHYVFNMRDLSKCVQGILQANRNSVYRKSHLVRLFYHECQRVFHDRLTDEQDKSIFCHSLAEFCTKILNEPVTAEGMKGLLYGDFMKMRVQRENRIYDEIVNKPLLIQILHDYLEEFNISTSKELQLVFFVDAAEHISRIARILRTDRGNALLVGVGGVGKQSLTKLGCWVSGYKCFQIQLMRGYDYSSFHDDLKTLYEVAGMKNERIVFLFTDTQIAYEEFLEDINNILNSGEVPNLLEPEDLERMMGPCRAEAKKMGIADDDKDRLYDFFIRRVRSNLHVVLSMSPIGDSFRVRCRMFPSLVNCCTIDWYSDWPTEALFSVAQSFMMKIDLGKVSADSMALLAVFVHESVTKMAERFFEEMRRKFYTTPSSYLELINLYTTMLAESREKIQQGKLRIQNGLAKLLETNELVKQMRVQLKELEPILVQKSQAVETVVQRLTKDQAAADLVRANVLQEEAAAKVKAIETQAIAEEAQRDLAEVMPALEAAVKALEALEKADITEIGAYKKPPKGVQTVMETVCILFHVKPDWNTSRLLLGDTNFIKKMMDYDKDSVNDDILAKLKPYLEDKDFVPEKVVKISKALKSLCMWVHAMGIYGKVFKLVEPKRKRYLAAQAELDRLMEVLRIKQAELAEVERQIAHLQRIYQKTLDEKRELEETMELTAARLRRAGQLTGALASEQARWLESIKKFGEDLTNLIGDIFVGAACIAYFGVFTSYYRQILVKSWVNKCVELEIPVSRTFTLSSLADPFEVRVWNSAGLPRDVTSTENGVLATRGRRWPLIIDPQDQANRWIKQMESSRNLKVLKMTDLTFMRTLENCLRLGAPALLEEVGEQLDPSLEPILLRQIFTQTGRKMIRLGDTNVDYDDGFRLYMTTKLANPHYLPEVCIKVTIINFTVTMSGLEDQLLGDVVSVERPDLESQRVALLSQINADKNMLISLESKILRLLYQSEGNILDDEELIQALNDSKATSAVITKRLVEAEITEEKISKNRELYRPAASRGSVLYFVVAQLAELDPMYQYSLKYFTQVFNLCIASVPKVNNLERRLEDLKEATTLATYTNISRGLFEKDKLIFSFLLCTDVMKSKQLIRDDEWNFFLRGGGLAVEKMRIPKPPSMAKTTTTQQHWNKLCDLQNSFQCFQGLLALAAKDSTVIQIGSFKVKLFDHKTTSDQLTKSLTPFQKVLLVKYLAEQKLVECITEFVKNQLGPSFIESPVIDLNVIYNDLNKTTPLVFVLSVGSDPMAGFYKFARDHEYQDRVQSISLGQGQGPVAESMIKLAVLTGDWVFLQNCHLASSWMLSLERIVKKIGENPEDVHDDFRLYLSSMPSPKFPVSVLQESVKITNEPPKGLRANVRRALIEMNRSFFETNVLKTDWTRMIFGICLFHAVIQERKKFGPLGWNIKYEFNDSDRECCLLNLEMFCENGTIPWDALEYITGQITYGGRITDDWDQRCLTIILKDFFSEKTLNTDHKFSSSGIYFAPVSRSMDEFISYADNLPMLDEPEIFGMHDNANITFQQQESNTLMTAILTAQPRSAGKGAAAASDDIVIDLATGLEKTLPPKIDLEKGNPALFRPDSEGRLPSQTVFLQQEVERFNKLLSVMRNTLDQLKKGVKGLVIMSEELERMYFAFLNNQVPEIWTKVSYGSLKSLSSWYKDLLLRVGFITSWLTERTTPSTFWLSGFFFQQGFLTAVLQTYARSHKLPIDQLKFLYKVTPVVKEQKEILDHAIERQIRSPRDGVFVHGLFIEAARWKMTEMALGDEKPGETVSMMPVIHFLPTQNPPDPYNTYHCPLYKTSLRAGTLSTTGHSTNFIVPIDLPSKLPEDYWILKGTALLTQLTD